MSLAKTIPMKCYRIYFKYFRPSIFKKTIILGGGPADRSCRDIQSSEDQQI